VLKADKVSFCIETQLAFLKSVKGKKSKIECEGGCKSGSKGLLCRSPKTCFVDDSVWGVHSFSSMFVSDVTT